MNETGIYLLEVNERDYHVTLTYYPWDGGDKREVFTTDALAGYIRTTNIFLWPPARCTVLRCAPRLGRRRAVTSSVDAGRAPVGMWLRLFSRWDEAGVALVLCPRLGVGVLPFSAVTRTEQDDEAAY